MERIPLTPETKPEDQNVLNNIMDGALGTVISLSSAPTTAGGELKDNQIGFNGTKLYIGISGSIYSISLSLT